jgi:hypothetical protein
MKSIVFSIALCTSLFSAGCGLMGAGDNTIVTEMPSDAAEKNALGPEAAFCLESAGHWDKQGQHCLITEKLCAQVGDWIGKSCSIPVTDCIEEGSHKQGSKCVIDFYSKEHMQTIMGSTPP